jgi:hypothetical protein
MILKILLPILLLASDADVVVSAFLRAAPSPSTTTATRRHHHHHHHHRHHRVLKNDGTYSQPYPRRPHQLVAAPPRASTTDEDDDRGSDDEVIGGSVSLSGSGGGRRRGDNGAMSFLRKMGRVGGAANMDFANALGLDESPSGGTKTAHHEGGFKVSPPVTAISMRRTSAARAPFLRALSLFLVSYYPQPPPPPPPSRSSPSLTIPIPVARDLPSRRVIRRFDTTMRRTPPPQNVRKSKAAYVPCAISGIVDDMSDPFPFTSSGSQWQGITDRVMGGTSNGSLSRETVDGRLANVLRGTVSLENGGGFVQMATDLSSDPSGAEGVFVDASGYDGVELDVYCEGLDDEERFNVQ